jgi:hypothetical protein
MRIPKKDIAKMSGDVSLNLVEASGGWFPREIHVSELESLAQRAFATRDMLIVQGFFERGHPNSPQSLRQIVIGKDPEGKLAMGSLVEEDSISGFPFKYVNKAMVDIPFQGNGYLADMMAEIMKMGVPVALRTSDEEISSKYARSSDIHTFREGYYIHGFGFIQKEDNKDGVYFSGPKPEKFSGSRRLFHDIIAPYIARKPATVVPMIEDVPPKGYDPTKAHYLRLHPFAKKEGIY